MYRALYGNVGAHQDGYQHGVRKPTETSVTEFCSESAISSNSVSNTVTVQTLKSPPQKLLFILHYSCLGHHVKASKLKRSKSQNEEPLESFSK